MDDNLNKMFQDDILYSDDEYQHNNLPNYDLFNKYVFDIFKEVEYTIIFSTWVVGDDQYPAIEEYLEWISKKTLKFILIPLFLFLSDRETEIE